MSDQGYFQFAATPRSTSVRSPIESPAVTSTASSPRWHNIVEKKSSSLSNEHIARHATPPRLSNSPTPQLNNTFSGIHISGHPSSPSPIARTRQTHSPIGKLTSREQDSSNIRQISPVELKSLLGSIDTNSCLIIDMCPAKQYQVGRIGEAINIPIPPILLKRPQYTVDKIANSLDAPQRERLLQLPDMAHVIIYDAESYNVGPGNTIYQVATKFACPNKSRNIAIVQGGYKAVVRDSADLVNHNPASKADLSDNHPGSSINVLGGMSCEIPKSEHVVNPFYNNIRQNQDLIGGVGEPIPLQVPELSSELRGKIPLWLRSIAFSAQGPRQVADKFLKIEKEELQRMKDALSAGTKSATSQTLGRHSVAAAVERGDKNRYNNIWPFENARVRLQGVSDPSKEYINASYLHAEQSQRTYIATQGPLPGTTSDFWQMVWENGVRTIVMLTKTVEGGQAKCHTYWDGTGLSDFLHLEVTTESQRMAAYGQGSSVPIVVRNISLSNNKQPLSSSREVTHIQFLEWPDLHVVQPAAILALVQEVQRTEVDAASPAAKRRKSISSITAGSRAPNPILSHCSAGCGRTGVFCTVDTVIDLVRKQLDGAHPDSEEFNVDLVEQTVRSFRDQRLSMVQT